jgi:hypothetical protein
MKTIIITAVLSMMLMSTPAQADEETGGLGILMGYSEYCEEMYDIGLVRFKVKAKEMGHTILTLTYNRDFVTRFGQVMKFSYKEGGCGKVKAMIKRNGTYFQFWKES